MKTGAGPARQARGRSPAPPGEPDPAIGLATAAAIYFGLSLIYFLPAFLPGQQVFGTDYLAGGYQFYHFISERLGAGALPKWVPYVFGGLPLFANPGSTYQPVHFLADLWLSTPRVFATVYLVHFWLAGVGMYLLARELGCRSWIALIAGLAFQFTGITLSWVYAGHDGRIIVATTAPLFFFFLHRGVRTLRLGPFAGAAATLGLALLSFQIQLSYYLLLGAAIWGVFCLFQLGRTPSRRELSLSVALALGAVAFGFLLATINFLPFRGYVPESPRGLEGRGYEFAVSYSMPPGELLSLAVPEQHGASVVDPQTGERLFPPYQGRNPFKLHTEYVGAFGLTMLLLGFFFSRRDRYWWFFLGLAVFMLTIALGGNTPLYRVYYELLPGTRQFRAPSLSFFMIAVALVTMAALTLERLARLREERRPGRPPGGDVDPLARLPWILAGMLGLVVLGLLASSTGGTEAEGGARAQGWLRFLLSAAATAGALWFWLRGSLGTRALVVVLAVVTVADLWVVGRRFLHTVPPPGVVFAPDDVIQFLRAQPAPFRIWTFPYPEAYRGAGAYGGNYPMLFGLEQVGGEHPNPLQRWNEYVGAGTRTFIDWHNLIEEAGIVETSEGQAIGFRGVPGLLDAANVRYVVSMAPLAHPALREVHRGSALVYENAAALPRAYLVPRVEQVERTAMIEAMRRGDWDPRQLAFLEPTARLTLPATPLQGEARVLVHEPDRVVVRTNADREALLVLADNYYPGWRATVAGRPAEVLLANHTFRAVAVPAGEQTVEFSFRPAPLYTGAYVTLAGFLLLFGYGGFLLLLRRRGGSADEAG